MMGCPLAAGAGAARPVLISRWPPSRRSEVRPRWPMALKLNVGKCTVRGNYRENNEDGIDVKHFPDLEVCIVADGMGGQAAGEVASKRAIEVIPRELRKGLGGVD